MTHYVAYNQSIGNALVGVSDEPIDSRGIDGIVIVSFDGDAPDMRHFFWNTATLSWAAKHVEELSKREFLARFTPVEYATIKAAAEQNAALDYYWQQFMLAEFIRLDDFATIAGINLLEQVNLIGSGRASEILA